jgi:quinol monooxygenase YgiN
LEATGVTMEPRDVRHRAPGCAFATCHDCAMSVLVQAEVHGLAGRAAELTEVLLEHAGAMRQADGCLLSRAAASLDAEPGEYVLDTLWRDEAAMRAHYATAEYGRYVGRIGELLSRPSDVEIHYVERSVRAAADLSLDPARQG